MTGSPIGRVVEIAEPGRHLSKERGFLAVSTEGNKIGRVPLDDLAAVVATSPGTTVSCALLAELATRNIPFTVCGRNFAPAAVLWPTEGHHEQQRRMEAQLMAPEALKERIWALIVAAKIARQGMALASLGLRSGAFERLAGSVAPGDPGNVEAQAARRYWPLMFGEDFRRDPSSPGINSLLNYGYALLRATAARGIAGAGLHPGLGIFHRHPRNAMPLADDIMEPFRPDIDLKVASLVAVGIKEVSTEAKHELGNVLVRPVATPAGNSPLGTTVTRLAQSLAASYVLGVPQLSLPLTQMASVDDAPSAADESL